MTLSKIIEQLKAADQNKTGMFELGEDVMCALVDLLERRERDKQEPNIGEISVGRLSTMNQDEYPGLGDWWVQLRIGEDSEEVLARVYGSTPQEANNRAYELASHAVMHGSTISNSADIAIDELPQPFGNSEQLKSPAVPDGYALVPIEPTTEMCKAFDYSNAWKEVDFWEGSFDLASGWRAMLAAAPKQESE